MPGTLAAVDRPLAIHIPNPFSYGASKVIGWIVSGITKAINAFFGGLVKDALNPLLKLLGQTLLTTPDPSTLPRVGALWENSREIAVASYALLILIAGILVMAYETVQTRHSIKEIAPRIVVGFLTANMSLLLAGKAVSFANALSTGVLSGGVDPKSAAATLTALVMNAVTNGGIFLVFIGLGLACILLALLVCYVIRVALTVILIAGAPLALMCHALPQTEPIARWWWRAFAGVLAIQLAQSLTLVAALNVFLAKGGFTFFGPTGGGLVDLIVTIALLYILFKIPFWILHSIQVGGGRSFIGSAVKGVIAYKTLGLLGLRGGASLAGRRGLPGAGGRPGAGGPGSGGPRGGGPYSGAGGGGPVPRKRPGGPRPSAGPSARAPRAGSSATDGRPRSTPLGGGRISAAGALAPVVAAGDADAPAVGPRPRLQTARPIHHAQPGLATRGSGTAAPGAVPRPPVLASTPRPAHPAAGSRSTTHVTAASGTEPTFPPRIPVDLPARPPRAAASAVAAHRPGSSGAPPPGQATAGAAALRQPAPPPIPAGVRAHRPAAPPPSIRPSTPSRAQSGR